MRTSCFFLTMIAAMGLMITPASAYTMFSDDFTGGASANWINPEVADYTNNNAAFNGSGNSDRDYLRTVDEDYATGDYFATVDLTNTNMVFFGLGAGIPKSTKWYEPQTDPFVWMRFNFGDFNEHCAQVAWTDGSSSGEPLGGPNLPSGTTIRAELSWEAATSTVTFRVDTDYDGTYDDEFSTVVEALAEEGATARLFFGGNGGVTVDNFSVSEFCPGDADKDGDVDADDAALLASHWLTMEDATWSMGDFNNDGKVDDIDATILATNWVGDTVASVPEPSTFVLLSIGALGLFVGKWRTKRHA